MRKKNKRVRQIKLFVFFSLLLTLLIILIVSTVGRQEFNAPHKLALEIIGTAQYGMTWITKSVKNGWRNYTLLVNVREENVRLREELQKHKAANNKYREAAATNIRLTKLLAIKEAIPTPTLTAEIIGMDPSQWFKTMIIDRGSNDGVQIGMPVITVEGAVGQVTNTSPNYAKILLATDPNSALDGLVQTTRVQGIIKGGGSVFHMEYVLKNNEVLKGDRIITSGLGGVFPKGVPIGTVSKVEKSGRGMFQKIEIEPAADFSQLEHLIIVMRKDPLAK
ncbi:MAG TPA: rod shape-determining protein MreC [Desulfobulbaceae bacterium]|nr:MAG: rod shape-determining protein MreC [Deltaproteobacteria bacterium RIFOXYD12_FULL_53_23]HCC54729.1 rod shape-determining protein MreC [Desulfobulbaceae bacterium]